MAAKGIQFRWRWDRGTISTQLDVIWGMSDKADILSITYGVVLFSIIVQGLTVKPLVKRMVR